MQILSRQAVKELVTAEPQTYSPVLIYEVGRYESVGDIFEKCKGGVCVEFNDSTMEKPGSPTKELVEYILEHDDIDIVACNLGVSRSSAIAYLLECKRSDPQTAVALLDPTKHFPNELILKYGVEILGEDIVPPLRKFFKEVAAFKKWKIEMVTKFFRS